MLNIAGVVILYYPDQDLFDRIKTYIDYVDKLYVIDNSETSQPFSMPHHKIVYRSDGMNKGIAHRLNQCADSALAENFKWLLTMDQDSFFPEGTLLKYFNCVKTYGAKDEVAMFGVQYEKLPSDSTQCLPEEVEHLITSGSILNLNIFQRIGPFDEALFIDKVDYEYCLRSRIEKYKIVRFNNIFLEHSLGKIVYGRSLKNFRVTPRVIHAPIRIYYILRNYFYLKEKYKKHPELNLKEMKKENWTRIKNNLLYGSQKMDVLKKIIKGIFDFKRNKMGKLR